MAQERTNHERPSPTPGEGGNVVLLRVLSAGPAECWEWGIDAEKRPYEKYQWCEDEFYEDSSFVKVLSTAELLAALSIQPVGNGLIDLICPPDRVDLFIDFCNAAGRIVRGFTWWCHVTEGHEPCGMGGPAAKYFDGWFSEIPADGLIRFLDNESYRDYFKNVWPADKRYQACRWPGFWLEE
jgi:hypothetical protein